MSSKKQYKTPKKSHGSGAYGSYFVINSKQKIGLKTDRDSFSLNKISKELCNWYESYVNSRDFYWQECETLTLVPELAALIMLKKVKSIPNGLDVVWVHSKKNQWNIGILMEHIDGEPVFNLYENLFEERYESEKAADNKIEEWKQYSEFEMKTEECGISVQDWHPWNVLVDKKNNFWRIDFSYDYFKVYSKHEKKFKEVCSRIMLDLIESFPGNFKND